MASRTHEQTINAAVGEVLQALGHDWVVRSEDIGGIFESGGRPDVLVERSSGWPIVLEAEVGNHRQAEGDALARLGNRLLRGTKAIDTVVALVYPEALRTHSGTALREAIRGATLEYALYTCDAAGATKRLPATGWISGTPRELALLLHRASTPAWRAEALADVLERGINRAEGAFSEGHPVGSPLGASLASVLRQSDDAAGQTRRMAMTVIADALIFHAALAECEMLVQDETSSAPRVVRSPQELRAHGEFLPTPLLDEWDRILAVNYWPIFHTAGALVRRLPTASAVSTLGALWETAEELVAGGVTRSHDLTGVIFQRLIADRKFLATFYTRPAAAALLAGLAMPAHRPLVGTDWGDEDSLAAARIGDFACGTGTLLSTAYQRLCLLHEVHGGDPGALHPRMMKYGLVGLDVLNVAVHLTATMLAGSQPNTPFDGECLLTMPYGEFQWGVCLGSLDLMREQASLEMMEAAALTAGGRGEEEVRGLLGRVGHGQFELVIMNPPFTRHGAREGDRLEVHNPAFAAFEATDEQQDRLAAHLKRLAAGGCAHGHAGLASYFADLAHRKVAPGGTVALVLPLSSMSGRSWEAVRALWRSEYCSIVITTIAERGTHTRSFSADTGMAECLFVARKRRSGDEHRAVFAILDSQPQTTLEGELIAQAIADSVAEGSVRTLEAGPFGGTRIRVGETHVGELLECPLPAEGAWQMVGVSDMSLGQTAYQLANGRLWIEGMPAAAVPDVPIARIGDVCQRVGPHHLDLTGAKVKADGLPQGPFERIEGYDKGVAYPSLWNHSAHRERSLVVAPDSHCRLRHVPAGLLARLRERAEARWATAARAHYSVDLQFNSQSLVVAMTDAIAIGGVAWPTIVFEDPSHEFAFALWSNSTLGLLCHWWMSNRTQAGRGRTTVTGIPLIPTLDVLELTAAQHDAAKTAFGWLRQRRLLPFDQIDEDTARQDLDRRLIVEVLGLEPALCDKDGPVDLLRRKLASEPSIHGDKQSRIVFTPEGEASIQRAE